MADVDVDSILSEWATLLRELDSLLTGCLSCRKEVLCENLHAARMSLVNWFQQFERAAPALASIPNLTPDRFNHPNPLGAPPAPPWSHLLRTALSMLSTICPPSQPRDCDRLKARDQPLLLILASFIADCIQTFNVLSFRHHWVDVHAILVPLGACQALGMAACTAPTDVPSPLHKPVVVVLSILLRFATDCDSLAASLAEQVSTPLATACDILTDRFCHAQLCDPKHGSLLLTAYGRMLHASAKLFDVVRAELQPVSGRSELLCTVTASASVGRMVMAGLRRIQQCTSVQRCANPSACPVRSLTGEHLHAVLMNATMWWQGRFLYVDILRSECGPSQNRAPGGGRSSGPGPDTDPPLALPTLDHVQDILALARRLFSELPILGLNAAVPDVWQHAVSAGDSVAPASGLPCGRSGVLSLPGLSGLNYALLLLTTLWHRMTPPQHSEAFEVIGSFALEMLSSGQAAGMCRIAPHAASPPACGGCTCVSLSSGTGGTDAGTTRGVSSAGLPDTVTQSTWDVASGASIMLLYLPAQVLPLLMRCVEPHESTTLCAVGQPRPLWTNTKPRAQWVASSGALVTCEALVRAGTRCDHGPTDHVPFKSLTTGVVAFLAALDVALQLPDDAQAQAALQGMTATLRKLIVLLTHGAGGALVEPTMIGPIVDLCDVLPSHSLARHSSTSTLLPVVSLCLAQLLPPAMRLVRACLDAWTRTGGGRCRACGPTGYAACAACEALHTWYVQLLCAFATLNMCGVLDLTLAAGVPGLLRALLQRDVPVRRRSGTDMLQLGLLVYNVMGVAAMPPEGVGAGVRERSDRCTAAAAVWVSEAGRLDMLGGLVALFSDCVDEPSLEMYEALPPEKVPMFLKIQLAAISVELPRTHHELAEVMLHYMDGMREREEAGTAFRLTRPSASGCIPTWDDCLMVAVHDVSNGERPSSGATGPRGPLVGCWCQGCVNLAEDAEAALTLRRCSSCRIARYCSEACQQQAWTAGHKAACKAWRQPHVDK